MKNVNDYVEGLHQRNIKRLVRKFGEENKKEITEEYNEARARVDNIVLHPEFTPSVLYPLMRKEFKKLYK